MDPGPGCATSPSPWWLTSAGDELAARTNMAPAPFSEGISPGEFRLPSGGSIFCAGAESSALQSAREVLRPEGRLGVQA